MSDTGASERSKLLRNAVTFQLKLMADGLRDLVLIPISLAAAAIGLLRGGDEPDREFQQVIEVGRQSEQWINLFGNHEAPGDSGYISSIDTLFTHVEEVLKQQYKAHGTSESAQSEIDDALQAVHDKAREQNSDTQA